MIKSRHRKDSGMTRKAMLLIGLVLALAMCAAPASAKRPHELVRVSADPYTNPSSQHRTEVEPDTFAHRGRWVGAFQVGRFVNGGASNIGFVTSTYGAQHFSDGFLPGITKFAGGSYDRASDPVVAYDAAHRVWLISSLAITEQPEVQGAAIVVSRSRDGLHWEPPVTVATGADVDKNWTVCDNGPTSPFYGHCYTEFRIPRTSPSRIKMTTSRDGGLSWSAPVETAGQDRGLGGQPVVQPDGTVIVPIPNPTLTALQAFRSTDGGQSWSAAAPITPVFLHFAAGGLNNPPLPSAEVDRDGKVYVAWGDCRFRAGCAANDIVMSTTTDGIDWSPVERVPIDPLDSGADHFLPGLGVDPKSSGDHGRLGLTYYSYPDAACTALTCRLNVGFVSSRDGGATWSEPTQLAGPMQLDWLAERIPLIIPIPFRFVGDYISTSFIGGRALPLFADAGPPSGGLLDEGMATIRGGLHVNGSVP
jgi:BNR repeat-like domain